MMQHNPVWPINAVAAAISATSGARGVMAGQWMFAAVIGVFFVINVLAVVAGTGWWLARCKQHRRKAETMATHSLRPPDGMLFRRRADPNGSEPDIDGVITLDGVMHKIAGRLVRSGDGSQHMALWGSPVLPPEGDLWSPAEIATEPPVSEADLENVTSIRGESLEDQI